MNRLHRADAWVGDHVRRVTRPGPRTNLFIAATTDLGSLFMIAPAGVVLAWKGHPRNAAEMTAAGGLAWIVGQRGKRAFNRRRPYQNEGIARLIPIPSGSSMPSGHAATAAAVATVLARGSLPGRRWPWALMALYVPVTRVHLGVHYPGDTLVGACVGHGLARAVLAVSAHIAGALAEDVLDAPGIARSGDRCVDGAMEPTPPDQLRYTEADVEAAATRLRAICADLPEISERVSNGAITFFVRDKRVVAYLQDDHHGDGRLALVCAAPEGVQEENIRTDPDRFFRPAYVGHRGWIGLRLDTDVDWDEVAGVVRESYRTVAPTSLARQLDEAG